MSGGSQKSRSAAGPSHEKESLGVERAELTDVIVTEIEIRWIGVSARQSQEAQSQLLTIRKNGVKATS